MTNRGFRTVVVFGLLASTLITAISLGVYLLKWPGWAMALVLLVYGVVQVSLATLLYRKLYESKLLDLPKVLRKRFPPLGYQYARQDAQDHFDVILLRTPSQVMSAPDCGEALGLGYLASVLRGRGLQVLVIDARLMGLSVMQTVELLQMYDTPMLGINLNFQFLAASTQQLIEAMRSRGFAGHITLGGLFASMAYAELMANVPGIDTIVRFEGEQTYLELIQNIREPAKWKDIPGLVYRQDGSVIVNPLRSLIADLDTIPDPARDFLPIARDLGGYAYVLSSRGCNGACSYCVQQRSVTDPIGKRWRGRSPKEVVDEMQALCEKEHVRMFSFVDDDFFGVPVNGRTHGERVADEIIARHLDVSILLSVQPQDVRPEIFTLLKRAGVDSVILAVDNFAPTVLRRYRKAATAQQNIQSIRTLDEIGIDAYLGIIMFDPWTTLDELAENFRAMQDLPYLRPWQILSKLEVYRGSPIAAELEKLDLVTWDGYRATYGYIDARMQSVYGAIEVVMKILFPSSAQFDAFRWGNLSFAPVDEWILKHSKTELAHISMEYGRRALDFAMEIVNRQATSADAVPPTKLADEKMQKEVLFLNESTLRKLTDLRKEATRQMEEAEAQDAPQEAAELKV